MRLECEGSISKVGLKSLVHNNDLAAANARYFTFDSHL